MATGLGCDDAPPSAAGADAAAARTDAHLPILDGGEADGARDAGPQESDAGQAPGDAGDDPCQPNPCTNVAGHQTRCLWDGQSGFTCHCDADYHDSEGLCCPQFSDSVNGACVCKAGYAEVAGKCVVLCSEDSIAGLNGWCPEGQQCVQGACMSDRCGGVSCPAHAKCVTRMDAAFCLCDEGFHLSGALCCPLNASEAGGACACDDGFVMQAGECQPDPTNPCLPTNPCEDAGLHRNTCLQDDSPEGYSCECNPGYEESSGACVLAVRPTCPSGLVCRNEVCVPPVLTQEQCVFDDDCHLFDGATTTCNASAAGGICMNCVDSNDCPGNSQCMSYGICALMCDDDSECPYGRCYTSMGYCGQVRCSADADCFGGTVCIDDNGDGQGLCLRIPCVETQCSPSKPHGTCAQVGEVCLYGACVADCTPNPCTQELNKSVCSTASGAVACLCDAGYELAGDGRCLPQASECSDGFTCGNGFCADRAAEAFSCQQDSDCGAGLTCSPTLPSGSCRGCGPTVPCPNDQDCLSGYCLQPCASHGECHPQMICRGTGYCGRKDCTVAGDCDAPYVCVAGSGGGASCQRPTCEGP
ncbi:MAG: hypothetical protein HY901_11760 [Deltaproteobacteria bacterium]|nr:hypothetical protein [Deltaproteobacteria bacterium]